ncbi:MAG TPA: hypothetical protein VN538_07525 [Clostridia bacterium]|nr:hypothetical protein [Clostridia bacterium]
MPNDSRKLPKKFQKWLRILSVFGFCNALVMFILLFSGPHLMPRYFAVDREERVYLSFLNGVYLAEGDRFYPVIKGTQQGAMIAISDDNVMYVADMGDYSAIDLNSSVPEEGIVVKHTISADQGDRIFVDKRPEREETDEQDGLVYIYHDSLFDYAVVRQSDGGERLLFQMPQSEFVLNMIVKIGFAIVFLSIAVLVLATYRYADKHPDEHAQDSDHIRNRKDERNNG